MLRVQGLSKSFGAVSVLQEVSLQLGDREHVGIVGPNGAGKTTLIKLLAELIEADEGEILRTPEQDVSYLPQDAGISSNRTLWEEMLAAFPDVQAVQEELAAVETLIEGLAQAGDAEGIDEAVERQGNLLERFEAMGGYRVEADAATILAGLGFSPVDRDKRTADFSGGWQMRIALARLLVRKPGVLLLDEPTNHLDLDACAWLEDYLAAYPGLVVAVSHDRAFLNRATSRTIEVADTRVTEFHGSYSAYIAERSRRRSDQQAAYERQQRYIAKQRAFIATTGANAARAALAKSRARALEKLVLLTPPPPEPQRIKLAFPTGTRPSDQLVSIKGLTKSFAGHPVLGGIDLAIKKGERIALLGPNGAGKSTLLKVLAGLLESDKGKIEWGHGASPGYHAQDQSQVLNEERTVLEEMVASAPDGWGIEAIRSLLARFQFDSDLVHVSIHALSGGQKGRLGLAKLLLSPRPLLLLDEPTNHLDIPSKEALEEALGSFPGGVLFASHDRFLIDRVATAVAVLEGGRIEILSGGWSAYHARKGEDAPSPAPAPTRRAAVSGASRRQR